MSLINPGDSMTHVMNNVLNPIINKANKYTSDLAGTGKKYVVDSRKINFSSSLGDSIQVDVVGMDPDEKVVRAVVAFLKSDGYTYFYPCTSVSFDSSVNVLTANFGIEVQEGMLFVEFWKRHDKETPIIELINGKTEMRKVRSDILNPAIERIKDLTQDVVKTGEKCICDHRSWKNVTLASTSINSTLTSIGDDEYPVRAMFRTFDTEYNKAIFTPAIYTRFHYASRRLNIFTDKVLGGRGSMNIEFWKPNGVTPLDSIPGISSGDNLANIRQNSLDHSLNQMNAHATDVTDFGSLIKNVIDYRSHEFDADNGHEEGFGIHLEADINPIRSALMVEDGSCHPCNTIHYNQNDHKIVINTDVHRKGEMFVEYWKDL